MICLSCGQDLPEGPRLSFCPFCGEKIIPQVSRSCPWEEREILGFFTSLISTLKESLTKPAEFYRKMPVSGGIGDPLIYAMIWGTMGIMFGVIWQILFGGLTEMVPKAGRMIQGFEIACLFAIAVLSPIVVMVGIFIGSGILQLCLMIVGGNKKGFEATFRVLSYSYSALILTVIPFCGSFLGTIWMVILEVIGLKEAHEISGVKAALAVFLPIIFCLGFVMVFLAIIIPILIGSLGPIPSSMKGIPI